jgi:hypothetical protein
MSGSGVEGALRVSTLRIGMSVVVMESAGVRDVDLDVDDAMRIVEEDEYYDSTKCWLL